MLCSAALVVGLLLRARQYLSAGSLWLDEAWLALNVLDRSAWVLLTEPLGHDQGAPPGFLLLVKAVAATVGSTDWTLRLVPFAGGLATLALSWPVARAYLRSAAGRLCFVGLVACSPVLVYYASELKQYSTDSAVCLLLLWVAERAAPRERWATLALVGSACLWLSHSSLFVLAAIGTILITEALWRRNRPRATAVIGVAVCWSLSFAALYWISLRQLASNRNLVDYWVSAYAPLPVTAAAELSWFVHTALAGTYLAFFEHNVVGRDVSPSWQGPLNLFALAICAAGMIGMYFVRRRALALVLLTLGFTTAVSAAHLYPLRGRLMLFFVPMVCLAAAGLVDWIGAQRHRLARPLAAASTVIVVLLPLPAAVRLARVPAIHGGMEYAVEHVMRRHEPGDTLMLADFWSVPLFRYYARQYDVQDLRVVENDVSLYQVTPDTLIDGWCRKPELGRTWIVLMDWDEQTARLHAAIDARLTVLDSLGRWGGTLQLVDLARDEACRATRDDGRPEATADRP